MGDTIPLPKVDYDAGWHRQYTADQMHAHAAAVTAAARDCRTCKHAKISAWVDSTRCTVSFDPCTNADRYEPLPPVRLWRTT